MFAGILRFLVALRMAADVVTMGTRNTRAKPMLPKPKPKKQKKSERKSLDAECMELLKEIVRLRDKTCVTPSASCHGYMTASHWQKRGKQRCRFDLRNINAQCQACNSRHNHYSGPYDAYMLRHYGYDVCLKLAEEASLIKFKWTIPELRDIRDGLKAELDKLKALG